MAAARSWTSWGVGVMSLALMACQSPTASGPRSPRGCVEECAEPDPALANFDVRFPWPAVQWIDEKLDLSPGHTGSESWADHLGLAGYHDNPVKRRRRAVMNALTFGLAQCWYDARGFGSPPD
jgi:hypothetical protein